MKLEKSVLYIHKLEYLGYIIAESGVKIDPEKINTITGWPTPRNVLEVQLFLGFTNFYRRFIKGYSKIALSLTNLTRKNQA